MLNLGTQLKELPDRVTKLLEGIEQLKAGIQAGMPEDQVKRLFHEVGGNADWIENLMRELLKGMMLSAVVGTAKLTKKKLDDTMNN